MLATEVHRWLISDCNGFCAMDSGWLDGLPCYECEFEPKMVGLNEATRMIACVTKTWFHRPLPQVASIRELARLR